MEQTIGGTTSILPKVKALESDIRYGARNVSDAAQAATERSLARDKEGLPLWEVGAPQAGIVQLARAGMMGGRVLDLGCGTGENALFLAAEGFDVLGVDASAIAVDRARMKARERDLPTRFAVGDALDLIALGQQFDTVIDSVMLDLVSAQDRRLVAACVQAVLVPGGHYHVVRLKSKKRSLAPRLSQAEIVASFARGWLVHSVTETRFHVLGSETDHKAWIVSSSRV